MGLDAKVFYNISSIDVPEPFRSKVVVVDPETGELDFEEGWENPHFQALIAEQMRIGNLDGVSQLRKAISKSCGEQAPIVLGQILGNAFGSSPPIPRSKIPELQKELDHLMAKANAENVLLDNFIRGLLRLCDVALREGNAIILC